MGLKISQKKGDSEESLLELGDATTSRAGLLSANDKKKLDGIAPGAETNQNAFGKIMAGEVSIAAGTEEDTLTLAAGSNVTLTADATTKKLTIASKNTTYTAATVAPKVAGTAAVGTSSKYAREDHVHPAQTSVTGSSGSCTGNAATATKLATSRNISLTGDVTGSADFNGTANASITTKLKNASVQLSASGTRSAAISANTNYTVPSYIVGSGRLQVFLDGVLCAGGSNADTCAYKEVGTSGKASTTIQFHQAIATDYEILVRVQ